MPIIELNGDSNDVARMHAVMLFPNDEAARLFFIERAQRETSSPGRFDADFELRLIQAKKSGFIAGELLAMLYVMVAAGEENPSLNRAMHALGKLAAAG